MFYMFVSDMEVGFVILEVIPCYLELGLFEIMALALNSRCWA